LAYGCATSGRGNSYVPASLALWVCGGTRCGDREMSGSAVHVAEWDACDTSCLTGEHLGSRARPTYDRCFGSQPFQHRNLLGRSRVVCGGQRVRTKPPPRICAKDRNRRGWCRGNLQPFDAISGVGTSDARLIERTSARISCACDQDLAYTRGSSQKFAQRLRRTHTHQLSTEFAQHICAAEGR
jgi:hypothetical protein